MEGISLPNYKNLFLEQSYLDSYNDYEKSLSKQSFAKWDYVILTASNDEQANTYKMQINNRLISGKLPKSTHYAVLPDPNGKRVGSGGATFNAINYIVDTSKETSFKNKRVLVIHSGGDSKRVPQYSACGKLFSPVPRLLPDGRRSTLFDEFIIGMSGVPLRIKDGMLVLSGDVLLLFNPLQIDIDSQGAAAISMKENVNTGKNHGVFLCDKNKNVSKFLHKMSVEKLVESGAVNEQNNVNIDTGAVIFSSKMVDSLYSLVNTKEKFNSMVNEKVRISFYADFLYPLAENSTLEQYFKETPEGDFSNELIECRKKIWNVLRKYRLKMLSLSPAQFIHFGTTVELLKLVTENIDDFSFLGWGKKILTNSDNVCEFSATNSYVSGKAVIGKNVYIEDSEILGNTVIGDNCVISNMSLCGEKVEDNTVLHGIKLKNGKFVSRKYNINTNPKINNFWEDSCFTVADSLADSLNNKGVEKISLKDSFNFADTEYIINWQKELENKIRVSLFLKNVKDRVCIDNCKKIFGSEGINNNELNLIINKATNSDFSEKIRIYYYLSKLIENNNSTLNFTAENLELKCFECISNSLLENSLKTVNNNYVIKKDKVVTRLPVRVNWGGGWTDTPPYCIENGGTVLNAALKLNGEYPILVVIKKLDKNHIVFESEDMGTYGEFSNIKEIQDCKNPYDPFALHKAALISCGIIPQNNNVSLENLLIGFGGGIYLSTQVLGIPKGSGLGTSSILSAACVKAIYEFFGNDISQADLYNTVLCMEQLMSTGGGWQDQVGGLTTGIKLITTNSGLKQNISVKPIELSNITKQELSNRFALIYTGQRRLARNLLREVVGKYISSNKEVTNVLAEIKNISVKMSECLKQGDIDSFAKLLNNHWELSQKLDKGCTNTCINQIFVSIEDLIDGKFICGAGGGGFIQVILKKGVSKKQLKQRLKTVFQDSGVDVWDSEFIF